MDFALYILIILIVQALGVICLNCFHKLQIIRPHLLSPLPFLEKYILSVGLGFPFLFFPILFVGLFFRFPSAQIIYIFLAIVFICLSKIIYNNIREIAKNIRDVIFRLLTYSILEKFTIFCISMCIIFNLIGLISPLTDYDSTVYHFAIPKRYVLSGVIIPTLDMHQHTSIGNVEMLYTFGLWLGREKFATLFAFTFSLLAPFAIYILSKKVFVRKTSILITGIFYTVPLIIALSSYTKTEIAMIFYVLLVFISFVNWIKTNENLWLILMGIFAGVAIGIKITSAFLIVGLFISLFYYLICRRDFYSFKGILFRLVVVGFLSFIIYLPWIGRTYLFIGKIYYQPGFSDVNKSGKIIRYFPKASEKYMKKNLKNYLCFPWNLTMHESVNNFWKSSPGPTFLMFVSLMLFLKKKNSCKAEHTSGYSTDYHENLLEYTFSFEVIKISLFCSLFGLTSIFLIANFLWSRFGIALIVPLSLCAGYVLQEFSNKSNFLRIYLNFLLLLIFCSGMLVSFAFAFERIPVAVGLENRESYLLTQVPFYKTYKFANEYIPQFDKVLVMYRQTYYINRNFFCGDPGIQTTIVNFFKINTQKQLYDRLKKLGIKWLIIHKDFYKNKLDESKGMVNALKITNSFTPKYFKKIYKHNEVYLYKRQ